MFDHRCRSRTNSSFDAKVSLGQGPDFNRTLCEIEELCLENYEAIQVVVSLSL